MGVAIHWDNEKNTITITDEQGASIVIDNPDVMSLLHSSFESVLNKLKPLTLEEKLTAAEDACDEVLNVIDSLSDQDYEWHESEIDSLNQTAQRLHHKLEDLIQQH